jgi:hypothetical protein
MRLWLQLAADSIEIPIGPVWDIVNRGGFGGLLFLLLFALWKGWLVTPKRFEDYQHLMTERLAAETARAIAAEKRELWWQDLAVKQGRLLPDAARGFEEAVALLERRSE